MYDDFFDKTGTTGFEPVTDRLEGGCYYPAELRTQMGVNLTYGFIILPIYKLFGNQITEKISRD